MRAIGFSQQLKIKSPAIIQAPMAGGITTPELVASASNSGALGSFATGYLTPDQVKSNIQKIKKLTKNPFSANIFIPEMATTNTEEVIAYQKLLNTFRENLGIQNKYDAPPLLPKDNFHEIIDVLLQEEVKIISFTFGNLPTDIINILKEKNIYLIGTATSLAEGKILADSGIDAIVAQGYEAGGHRGGFLTSCEQSLVSTMLLLQQLVAHIDLPIIAAGGIMNGQSIVSAVNFGASAVQMGTAFLITEESGANPVYKTELAKLKHSTVDPTRLTKTYSGKMARAVNTEFIEYMESHATSIPPYPITNSLCRPIRKEASKQGKINIMSMWAGQGVPLIEQGLSTEKLLGQLHDEAQASINNISEFYNTP